MTAISGRNSGAFAAAADTFPQQASLMQQLDWYRTEYGRLGERINTLEAVVLAGQQTEAELRQAKQTAERAAKSKEQFLANMSHEIRTPIHALMSLGQQLLRSPLNDRQHFYLDMMNTAANNLLVIINDILDFSKIEAGQLDLETIGFNLPQLIHKAVHVMHFRAEERKLELSVHIEPGVAPVLLGDPFRLNQVLLNLLSNALKFTVRGSVRVDCRLQPADAGQQALRLQVTDTGVGMDEAFLASLFDPFTQEDGSIARRHGGTGLGMPISRQLVERMGGSIHVESRRGVGTTVTIDLCLPIGQPADLRPDDERVANTSVLQNKRILLVEDNPMNRLVATTILDQYGAQVVEAVNGLEAVEALADVLRVPGSLPFDLVLMDIQMPILDGLGATHFIRHQLGATVPIIALTANAILGERDRCLSAGMDDFLTKPFDEDELVRLAAKWVNREVLLSTVAPVPTDEADKPLFSTAKLETISRGNTAFVRQMLALFCDEMPTTVIQINESFLANDLSRVRYLAHRIKPTIDNLNIASLRDDIRQIEQWTAEQDTVELSVLISKLARVTRQIVAQIRKDGNAD